MFSSFEAVQKFFHSFCVVVQMLLLVHTVAVLIPAENVYSENLSRCRCQKKVIVFCCNRRYKAGSGVWSSFIQFPIDLLEILPIFWSSPHYWDLRYNVDDDRTMGKSSIRIREDIEEGHHRNWNEMLDLWCSLYAIWPSGEIPDLLRQTVTRDVWWIGPVNTSLAVLDILLCMAIDLLISHAWSGTQWLYYSRSFSTTYT